MFFTITSCVTETATNETTIGETTSVEKTTIEEPTTKVIESTTKKELTTSSVTTTKAAETTIKIVSEKTALPDYSPDYNALNMFDKVNNYRAQNGVNKMILDDELCKMAYIRAQEQAVKKGNERPDDRRFLSIANDYNYNCTHLGENIAHGSCNAFAIKLIMQVNLTYFM